MKKTLWPTLSVIAAGLWVTAGALGTTYVCNKLISKGCCFALQDDLGSSLYPQPCTCSVSGTCPSVMLDSQTVHVPVYGNGMTRVIWEDIVYCIWRPAMCDEFGMCALGGATSNACEDAQLRGVPCTIPGGGGGGEGEGGGNPN